MSQITSILIILIIIMGAGKLILSMHHNSSIKTSNQTEIIKEKISKNPWYIQPSDYMIKFAPDYIKKHYNLSGLKSIHATHEID